MTKRIQIDPITRLEGHGRIDIFLNDEGDVENCFFVVPELRGFEAFCVGRPVEEMPRITTRICGVCSEAHHMASAKACDAVYHVDIPSAARKLRELLYSAFYVADHCTHFYILGGPDFVMGPDAPPAERNILGMIEKLGLDAGKKVIGARAAAHEIISILGGKSIHMVSSTVGGVTKGVNKEELQTIRSAADTLMDFAHFTIKVVDDIVLANKDYVEMILSDAYTLKTHSMGTVDENNHVNFYDGKIRIVDTEGRELHKYDARDYLDYVKEHVETWSYLKFPYLISKGWHGLSGGQENGVYIATPLSRLNAADGMATPVAQEQYERFYDTLTNDSSGRTPVLHTLATHWARVIELVYAAERTVELAHDDEILSDNLRVLPTEAPDEGVGCVEAPRGTLTHHYQTDENGMLTKVNLIVGTTNNNAAICMSVKQAAKSLIKRGVEVSEGLLNRIEMAFRAYDPCFACATHSLPGQMPLTVTIRDSSGEILREIKRS